MDKNQLYDQQTLEVMARVVKEDSNCIDVGCHAGVMLDSMLKLAPQGQHFAFEPLPDLCRQLKNKYSRFDNVQVFDNALSDSNGLVTFQHVVSNPGYSGLKRRRYDRPDEVIQEITVTTCRLDDLIPAATHIAFIKIDVEGGELQVLSGAVETIRRSKPAIVFEHGLGAADYYKTTPESVFDLLTNVCGLNCFTMERWLASHGNDALGRQEFCDEFYSGRHYYFMAS